MPGLKTLVQRDNPFEDLDILLKRLRGERSEGRHLEWKTTLPIGKEATKKHKYRFARAAISFANTEGGFILVGVAPDGTWRGLDPEVVRQLDHAHFSEMFYECCTPDFEFGMRSFEVDERVLLVLFVPASQSMPHITTKEFREGSGPGSQNAVVIAKHVVYCRRGAKSDAASPGDYERIISRRVAWVRDELVRRVKEVVVPMPLSVARLSEPGKIGSVHVTDDELAFPVRYARPGEDADVTVIRESLDSGVLDDVDNLAKASLELSTEPGAFALSTQHYYRLYAERERLAKTPVLVEHLARCGYREYAPMFYWVTMMPDALIATHLTEMRQDVQRGSKGNRMYLLIRLVALLGDSAEQWLMREVDRVWSRHPQPPDYVHRLREKRRQSRDKRLRFLSIGADSGLRTPWDDRVVRIGDLLESPRLAKDALSLACKNVAEGKGDRTLCRTLDIIGYGDELMSRGETVSRVLHEVELD